MISIESKDRIVIITFNTDNINALNVDEIKNQIIKTLKPAIQGWLLIWLI
jgi:hypothetical protein